MKTLPYIEDYIEIMGAHYALTWPIPDAVIKLARYDEPIVNSMANQIQNKVGFTDRQAVLAHKIVIKYRKQWLQQGYEVSHLADQARYRYAIRAVDRRLYIDVVNNAIEIRFPYDQTLISKIRAAVQDRPGSLLFDRDRRAWIAALIEPRIIWAREFGLEHGFEFSDNFQSVLELMLAQSEYSIKLVSTGQALTITNAEKSLIDYVQNQGGFGFDNLVGLIDLAGICGYTVDPVLYDSVSCDDHIHKCLTQRDIEIKYETDIDIQSVVKYAALTNRYPIYVYESGTSVLRNQINQYFKPDQITDLKLNPKLSHQGPVIYFNHWKLAGSSMPLLITTHTLMIGSRRQQMLHAADKVIYFTQQFMDQDA